MKLQIVVYESTSGGENLMHKQRLSFKVNPLLFQQIHSQAASFWIFHEARSTASNEDAAFVFHD